MPARLMSPTVGFNGDDTVLGGGRRSEPEVSVPIATAVSPAATATAEPDSTRGLTIGTPLALNSSAKGFLTWPPTTNARRHVDRQDIGELGEVRFAEDHGAGLAQGASSPSHRDWRRRPQAPASLRWCAPRRRSRYCP